MQENTKQVIVKMTARRAFRTEPIYQYDVGHELVFDGFDLPNSFEVHFSRSPMGQSITQIGTGNNVTMPPMFAQAAGTVYAWLYIATSDTGLTKFEIEIPVSRRAKITDQQPTPVEQSAIDQAIAALNAGVQRAEQIEQAIPQTINTALAEAKASGEFDGPQGPQGATGPQGPQGIPGDPTELIDDTAGAGVTNKTWSANKLASDVSSAINQKQDAPSSPGTAGQVLGLDANLDPAWVDQTGGGGQTDIGLSVVNGMICVTYEEAV